MRFRLRTLLIVLALAPPLVAYLWLPPPPVPIKTMRRGETAEVDLIQLHECCDPTVARPYREVIFWSRHSDGQLHVRTYRLIGSTIISKFHLDHSGRECQCTWTEFGVKRLVRARTFEESKSAIDPELQDRLQIPKAKRIPLWVDTG